MLTRFRKIAYVMAYAVATIPLWHYIRDGRILVLMVAFVAFAYLFIVLSTVEAAQPILSSEKAKTPLPRWLPDKPKYHKWWMLVRHTLKWHLLLIPPKMGLALGFVQWLFVSGFPSSFFVIGETYNYPSNNLRPNEIIPQLYPQTETLLLGLICLTAFSVLNTYVVGAYALLANNLVKNEKRIMLVVIVCIFFSLFGLGSTTVIRPLQMQRYDSYISSNRVCQRMLVSDPEIDTENCKMRKRIFETGYSALLTPFDQSVLLSANMMRPMSKMTFLDLGFPYWNTSGFSWDNRPFVARQIVAGVIGLLLYAGATWVTLWFIEDEVVSE